MIGALGAVMVVLGAGFCGSFLLIGDFASAAFCFAIANVGLYLGRTYGDN